MINSITGAVQILRNPKNANFLPLPPSFWSFLTPPPSPPLITVVIQRFRNSSLTFLNSLETFFLEILVRCNRKVLTGQVVVPQ